MPKKSVLVFVVVIAAACAYSQEDFLRERNDGYLQIFNGLNVQGWTIGEGGGWKVEDSTLVGDAASRWIRTDHDAFTDYVVRFDWRISPGSQASLLLRGDESPGAAVNLGDRPEGSGGMDAFKLRPRKKMDTRVGEWNHMEVRVQGNAVEVKLNDQVVVGKSPMAGLPERGPLGFQSSGGTLAIRSLRLKPTGLDVTFFIKNVQPVFKLQCVGCHSPSSSAGRKFPVQIPELGNYDDAQILKDYLEAAARVRPGKPEDSLLINKAIGKVAHGGGRQFAVDGPEHKAFVAWVKGETLKRN